MMYLLVLDEWDIVLLLHLSKEVSVDIVCASVIFIIQHYGKP